MAEWNQNSPATKGIEWRALAGGSVTLDSALKNVTQAIRQTVSQDIGSVKVRLGAIPVRGGIYAVSWYDGETSVISGLETLAAQPNEDVSGTGLNAGEWRQGDADTTTIYTEIDETAVDNDLTFIRTVGTTTNGRYTSRFNTGGLTLTGKRILAVRLNIWHRGTNGGGSYTAGLNLSGTDYLGITAVAPQSTSYTMVSSAWWYYNPSTKKPWTIAEIQALDTSDEWWVEAYIPSASAAIRVSMVSLEVVCCTENRLAVGTLDDSASGLTADAYNTVTLTTPTGGTWTKDGAGYHTCEVRRISASGALVIPYFDEPDQLGDPVAPNPAYSMTATLDATYGYATAMGDPQTHVFPIVLRTTAPADSTDSQPYADVGTTSVFTGQDVEQEFSDAAGALYGTFRFWLRPYGATQPIFVRIKRRSDNVQLGATLTLSPAEVAAMPDLNGAFISWRFITATLDTAATLAPATQYYIEFSSSVSGVGDDYWGIVYVDTETHGDIASFGGTTDRGVVGGVEADRYDIIVTVSSIPAPPEDLVVTVGYQAIDATTCGVARIAVASLSWTASALGADFVRYDVRRSDDDGVTWETIGAITDESLTTFEDYEARRGVRECYQVRVVRSDGLASTWTPSVCTVVPAQAHELLLVSNYDPSLNVAYERDPEVTYDILDSHAEVFHPIYGRDRQLGFQPTEELGVVASYMLHVGFNTAVPAGGGRGLDAFDPVRAIAKAPLPYVAVLDHYGGRLYAMLAVPSGRHLNPGQRYLAELVATEVSATAYAVDGVNTVSLSFDPAGAPTSVQRLMEDGTPRFMEDGVTPRMTEGV